jgi:thermosome
MMKKNDILDENTSRSTGKNAIESNIQAAIAVSEIVKSTLGPMGMDKMLIDSFGETVITNDGVKILKEMEIEHPGAKILVDIAKTQDEEVGDGTTSAVILSASLLEKSLSLINKKIHPSIIIRVYKICSKEALKCLNSNSRKIDDKNSNDVKKIIQTAIMGKVAEYSKEDLSELLFEVIKNLKDDKGFSKSNLKILKSKGGNIEDSFMEKGIILDKKIANNNMPKILKKPKILLIDFPLEIPELDTEAKVNISSLEEYEAFIENEKKYLKSIVMKIKEIGVNFIVCQKGIDDSVAYYLAKENILALRRVRKSDMDKLSLALNIRVVSNIDDILAENLSTCSDVFVENIQNEEYVFVKNCSNPRAVTLFLRASNLHTLDELERAVEDCLGDLNSILKSKKVVCGGGSIEMAIRNHLLKFANNFNGKENLIAKSYAESFLEIPKVLCENCGFDEIEVLNKLEKMHKRGENNSGIDIENMICDDNCKKGIIEPINVKEQAIKSALESCATILRIDDIIAAKKLKENSNNLEENF